MPLFVRGPGVAAGSEIIELRGAGWPGGVPGGRRAFAGAAAAGRGTAVVAQGRLGAEGFSEEETGSRAAYGAIRSETHKYVEYENGERELYGLEADPYELDNVYEVADSSLVEDLKARLDALRSSLVKSAGGRGRSVASSGHYGARATFLRYFDRPKVRYENRLIVSSPAKTPREAARG